MAAEPVENRAVEKRKTYSNAKTAVKCRNLKMVLSSSPEVKFPSDVQIKVNY